MFAQGKAPTIVLIALRKIERKLKMLAQSRVPTIVLFALRKMERK